MIESKSIFLSKTFWFNVLATGVELANSYGQFLPIPPATIGIAVSVGNIILRRLTKQPVHVIEPYVEPVTKEQ